MNEVCQMASRSGGISRAFIDFSYPIAFLPWNAIKHHEDQLFQLYSTVGIRYIINNSTFLKYRRFDFLKKL